MAIDTEQPADTGSVEDKIAQFYADKGIGTARKSSDILRTATPQEEAVPEQQAAHDEQADEAGAEQSDTDSAADADGFVDVEWEGETHRLTPKIRDSLMSSRDYTKKTQDLADLQRIGMANAEREGAVAAFNAATADDQKQLAKIQASIEAWEAADWRNLDVSQIATAQQEIKRLEREAQKIQTTLQQKGRVAEAQQADARSKAVSAAYEFIGRHVKGFAPDSAVEKEVAAYVGKTGLSLDMFTRMTLANPSVAVNAYKAMKYDAAMGGKMASVRAAQKAPPVIKPGATGAAPATKKQVALRDSLRKTGDPLAFTRLMEARFRKG